MNLDSPEMVTQKGCFCHKDLEAERNIIRTGSILLQTNLTRDSGKSQGKDLLMQDFNFENLKTHFVFMSWIRTTQREQILNLVQVLNQSSNYM